MQDFWIISLSTTIDFYAIPNRVPYRYSFIVMLTQTLLDDRAILSGWKRVRHRNENGAKLVNIEAIHVQGKNLRHVELFNVRETHCYNSKMRSLRVGSYRRVRLRSVKTLCFTSTKDHYVFFEAIHLLNVANYLYNYKIILPSNKLLPS